MTAEVPDSLCCPITLTLFVKPVLADDGNTYSDEAIKAHIRVNGNKSPLNPACRITGLMYNRTVANMVEEWVKAHPQDTPSPVVVTDPIDFSRYIPATPVPTQVPIALAPAPVVAAPSRSIVRIIPADIFEKRKLISKSWTMERRRAVTLNIPHNSIDWNQLRGKIQAIEPECQSITRDLSLQEAFPAIMQSIHFDDFIQILLSMNLNQVVAAII